MNYNYRGKLVIVTGGTGQAGRVVARAYAEAGATVVIADRAAPNDPAEFEGLIFHSLDVLDEAGVEKFFEEVIQQHGPVYALVNTVGGYHAGEPVSQLRLKDFEGQFELNLKSAFLLTRAAVKSMAASGGGKIVHFSSRAAVEKGTNSFAYSASKQAVVRLVEAVAQETRHQNININCLMPSIIDTPTNRASMPGSDFKQWPTPEQISKVLLFLTSEEAELISGAAVPVYGRM